MISKFNNYMHSKFKVKSTPITIQNFSNTNIVSAVNFKVKKYHSIQDYQHDVESYFIEAKRQNSSLLCFPELFGMIPLLFIPFVRTFLFKKSSKVSSDTTDSKEISILNLLKKFDYYQESLLLLQHLAMKYKIYVCSGSMFVIEDNKIYNRQHLVSPEGEILGFQNKLHLVDMEKQFGLTAGDDLKTFDLPFGKLCMPICMDASYFETLRIAKKKGCTIIALPIANMEEYNYYLALRGLDMRMKEVMMNGIKSPLILDGALKITGVATLFQNGAIIESTTTKKVISMKLSNHLNPDIQCHESIKNQLFNEYKKIKGEPLYE
ncbi:MAG: nitrilase-related carbon-nitrogen hydrolase [Longicatena sp.]